MKYYIFLILLSCVLCVYHAKGGGLLEARMTRHPLGPWSKEVENLGHKGNPESPFMIQRGDDFYLWEQMNVFHSKDPMNLRNGLLRI